MGEDGYGMSTVRGLHDEAMKLSQLALVARHTGEEERAERLARQAYELETKAAELVPEGQASEPTRSILYRSAASLALQSKEYRIAQQLIAKGLSGYPPPRVEQELKTLYEQVNFELNLQSHGVHLIDDELRMALRGKAVGYGQILYKEFIKRVESAFTLIDRTVQRRMGREYVRVGRVPHMYKPFTRVLSAFEAGSFVVSLRLGLSEGQQLPLFVDSSSVIDEVLTGIALLNDGDRDRLRELIPSEGYYQNFVTLARELAPDGDQVESVNFSTKERLVNLDRPRNEIELLPDSDKVVEITERTKITVEGVLDFASSREGDVIGLTSEKGIEYTVKIREGFDDLVRSYFKNMVVVTGWLKGKEIDPLDIRLGGSL